MLEKKALVVDDSKLALFVLEKMLTEESLAVDTAGSAVEALGYLVHNKPDVIFLDHSMPGMNGLEALKIIKDNPDTATIPVMMYTSKEGEVYVSQARALGAIDILPKQLQPVVLHNVLQKINLVQPPSKKPQTENTDNSAESDISDRNQQSPAGTLDEAVNLPLLTGDTGVTLEKDNLRQIVKQEMEQQADLLVRQARAFGRIDISPEQLEPDVLHDVVSRVNLKQMPEEKPRSDAPGNPADTDTSDRNNYSPVEPADEAGELALLVSDAEANLEKETLTQLVKQKVEQQADTLGRINIRLDRLISEYKDNMADVLNMEQRILSSRRSFFRMFLAALVLSAFGYGYFKLNTNMLYLKQQIAETSKTSESLAAIFPGIPLNNFQTQGSIDTRGLLYVLEESMANNFSLPYGQSFLQERQMQLLSNLLESLNAMNYAGNLDILVHGGDFCVIGGAEGALVLPPSDMLMTGCEVKQSFDYLEQNVVPNLREFVNNAAYGSESKYDISIENWGSSQLSARYPQESELLTAGEWNEAAQKNQRLQIVFR